MATARGKRKKHFARDFILFPYNIQRKKMSHGTVWTVKRVLNY